MERNYLTPELEMRARLELELAGYTPVGCLHPLDSGTWGTASEPGFVGWPCSAKPTAPVPMPLGYPGSSAQWLSPHSSGTDWRLGRDPVRVPGSPGHRHGTPPHLGPRSMGFSGGQPLRRALAHGSWVLLRVGQARYSQVVLIGLVRVADFLISTLTKVRDRLDGLRVR